MQRSLRTLALLALLLALPAAVPPMATGADTTTVIKYVPAVNETVTASLGSGAWVVTVTGKFTFGQSVNGTPSEADAAYSYSGVHGSCYNWPDNKLDLHINGVSPWSNHACQPLTHSYSTTHNCGLTACTVSLWIKDEPYYDNSGGLTVTFTRPQTVT